MTRQSKPRGVLVDAAKAIGRTIGKVAILVGAEPKKAVRRTNAPKTAVRPATAKRAPARRKKRSR